MAGVFGLIRCISLSLSLALPTFFNNNNDNIGINCTLPFCLLLFSPSLLFFLCVGWYVHGTVSGHQTRRMSSVLSRLCIVDLFSIIIILTLTLFKIRIFK